MTRFALVLLSVIAVLAILVQGFIAWAWMRTDVIEQFMNIFRLYPEIPRWSQIAFGTRAYCWVFPLSCTALYAIVMCWRRTLNGVLGAAVVSILVLGAMVYAMYPIDRMPSVAANEMPNNTYMDSSRK